MPRIRQTDVGRCDFIDVLEEAVVIRPPITVELHSLKWIEIRCGPLRRPFHT